MFKKFNGYKSILSYLPLFLIVLVVVVVVRVTSNSTNVYAKTNDINIDLIHNFSADSSKIYDVVDQMPEIEGGLKEVYDNIKYPPLAISRGIEGRVFVKFVVNTNGSVKDPVIIRDIGGGCGQAAVDAIKKSKFKPGKHQGNVVNVYFTLPIDFKLK